MVTVVYFSKIVLTHNQEFTIITKVLLQIVRDIIALELHTDRGRNFESDLGRELSELFEIKNN